MTENYLIYNLIPEKSTHSDAAPSTLPVDLDFKTSLVKKLFPDWEMEKGAPKRVIYYENAESVSLGKFNFSNPIVKIEFEFERDELSFATKKIRRIYWMTEENGWSVEFKEMVEIFTKAEAIQESEKRRRNIISDLKVNTIGLLMMTESLSEGAAAELGKIFLSDYKDEIINYIDEANKEFLYAIQTAPVAKYSWLDNQIPQAPIDIRTYMISQIV